MFVLYQGEVNVIANDEDKVTSTLSEPTVFGEVAMVTDERRTAHVVARSPLTVCLLLFKKDYKEILFVRFLLFHIFQHVHGLQKSKRQQFLQGLPFFKEWSYIHLIDINAKFSEIKFQPDDIVYDIGRESDTFYILKSGRMIIETILEIEDYHKFPIVSNRND